MKATTSWHADRRRSRPAASAAAAPATWPSTGSPRSKRRRRHLHHLRGRQHRPDACSQHEALLTDYAHEFGGAQPGRDGARSSPARRSRRWSSGCSRARSSQVIADAVPSRDGDRQPARPRTPARPVPLARGPHHRFGGQPVQARPRPRAIDPFEVFRAVQDHAINAARAYMDRADPRGVHRGDRRAARTSSSEHR